MTESLVDNGSLSFRMVSEFSIRFGPQIYRIDGAVCQSREQDHAVGMCALKRKAFVLDRDLPSPYRTRVPSCSRPSPKVWLVRIAIAGICFTHPTIEPSVCG